MAHQLPETSLSSSWNLRTRLQSSRTETSLLTDRRLNSWLSCAVLTTWSKTLQELTSGGTPFSPSTHYHGQHCGCSRVIQIPGIHHLSRPEVGQSHSLNHEKGPAEAVFLCQLRKIQPATGSVETVLLCHHRVCPVVIYNCLVWFSYQNRHQKTTTDRQDCWEDYWCPSAQPPKNFTPPEWRKGLRKSLWTPHNQLTLSLNSCHLAGATDHWAPKQPDTRTVFFPQAISHQNNS